MRAADVILLIGARLNWILHFGLPPRFRRDVKVIQVEICAEEIGTNVRPEVALVGHAKAVTQQLLEELARKPWRPSCVSRAARLPRASAARAETSSPPARIKRCGCASCAGSVRRTSWCRSSS